MKKALILEISGIVQGVGFRPFIWRLAKERNFTGWIRNTPKGVEIFVEGEENQIINWKSEIRNRAPNLSMIENIIEIPATLNNLNDFTIKPTIKYTDNVITKYQTSIGADISVCNDCLSDLINPTNRRYRYPFITCTNCGPRYTVAYRLPYDRIQTSLANFILCKECNNEYNNYTDRRFHAETTCCEKCGPKLTLVDDKLNEIKGDPINETLKLILSGKIVAIKGLGGFHLVCDATNKRSVELLRLRKNREQKPLALMFANINSAKKYAKINLAEQKLLSSNQSPIVLVSKKNGVDLSGIASKLHHIGVMLPTTPIHWLLFHEYCQRTQKPDNLHSKPINLAFVMTSANPGGEPIVIENNEAITRLIKNQKIADAILFHDRDIVTRCDDSVIKVLKHLKNNNHKSLNQFIRRSRGYTPQAIKLPEKFAKSPSTLALGAYYKNTICVTKGNLAYLSQHIGTLDNRASCEYFENTIDYLLNILEIKPQIIAHDLHPDFFSTQYAHYLANKLNIRRIKVQHHHAHIASVLAEHRIINKKPIIALAMDGVGFGEDNINDNESSSTNIWGGELLLIEKNLKNIKRIGHLQEILIPGSDSSVINPWRIAAGMLFNLNLSENIPILFPKQKGVDTLVNMLKKNINCPYTTSAGRLFDGVAALLNICENTSFEGQAPMILEGYAQKYLQANCEINNTNQLWEIKKNILSLKLYLEHLVNQVINSKVNKKIIDKSYLAAEFHLTFAQALISWIIFNCKQYQTKKVILSGGCILNSIITNKLFYNLAKVGIEVLINNNVPPNDGGISLGQAYLSLLKYKK